jgi:hypothetical protein
MSYGGETMAEDKELLDKMIWKVANGEIKSGEAAEICGMKYPIFYKRLRKNKEAFAVFREKVSKRKKPLVEHKYNYEYKRDSNITYEERVAKVMADYHDKCKLPDKARKARALGMSYGYYSALVNGLGKF